MNNEYEQNHFDIVANVTTPDKQIKFNDKISLKDVSFEYQENTPVLKNVSFEIKKENLLVLLACPVPEKQLWRTF